MGLGRIGGGLPDRAGGRRYDPLEIRQWLGHFVLSRRRRLPGLCRFRTGHRIFHRLRQHRKPAVTGPDPSGSTLVIAGTGQELLNDPRVRSSFLGG